jgi:uncharacterized protein YdiU (UPF0061 family)
MKPSMKLEDLRFGSSYASLGPEYATPVQAQAAPEPRLAAVSPEAAVLLGLDPGEAKRELFLEVFAGARTLSGMRPVASFYAGHQFGVPVPRLGDGRALILGETQGPAGTVEVQLKGSGLTPFSRMGDGRAVLRSCLREFLCSEAMQALGIPTSRALAVVASPEPVRRETIESRAVLTRLAPTHVRFGSFEYFWFRHHAEPDAWRERSGRLADYVISRFYPGLSHAEWFAEVCRRTARLLARWQAVGFNHGVMNTDNFSVLGITLDYGPFGFLEEFDPGYVCNHSDTEGRYAFGEQPRVALWNLNVLANALGALVTEGEAAEALRRFEPEFRAELAGLLRGKFGLREARDTDSAFFAEVFACLHAERSDYTRFFRDLPMRQGAGTPWFEAYRARLEAEGQAWASPERRARMDAVNPKYVLRNYLAQTAIERAQAGDFTETERLRRILARPFDNQPEHEAYAAPSPEWGKQLEVSCSS